MKFNRPIGYGLAGLVVFLLLSPFGAIGLENWTRYGTGIFRFFPTECSLSACIPLLAGVPWFAHWLDRRLPSRPWQVLLMLLLFGEIAGLFAFGVHLQLGYAGFSGIAMREWPHLFPWPVLLGFAYVALIYTLQHFKQRLATRIFLLAGGLGALAGYRYYLNWRDEISADTYARLQLALRSTQHAWPGVLLLFLGAATYGAIRRIAAPASQKPVWPGYGLVMVGFFYIFFSNPYPAGFSLAELEKNHFLAIRSAQLDDQGRVILQARALGNNSKFKNGEKFLLHFVPGGKRLQAVRRALSLSANSPMPEWESPFDRHRLIWTEVPALWWQLFYDSEQCEIVSLGNGRSLPFQRIKAWEQRLPQAPFCQSAALGPGLAWAYWDAENRVLRGIRPDGRAFQRALSVNAPPKLLSTPHSLIVLSALASSEVPESQVRRATTVVRFDWHRNDVQISELPGMPLRIKPADDSGGAAFSLRDPGSQRETWYAVQDSAFTPLDSGADSDQPMLPVWNGTDQPASISLNALITLLQASGYGFDPRYDSASIRVIAGHWLVEMERNGRALAFLEIDPGLHWGRLIASITGPVDWRPDSALLLASKDDRWQIIKYSPARDQSELLLSLPHPPVFPPVAFPLPSPHRFEPRPALTLQPGFVVTEEMLEHSHAFNSGASSEPGQCTSLKWSEAEIGWWQTNFQNLLKPGEKRVQYIDSDPPGTPPRELRDAGFRQLLKRPEIIPCLRTLWNNGHHGYFWEKDRDAPYHFLYPVNESVMNLLECSDRVWLIQHLRSKLSELQPFALTHPSEENYADPRNWLLTRLIGGAQFVDRNYLREYLKPIAKKDLHGRGDLYLDMFFNSPCCDPIIDYITDAQSKQSRAYIPAGATGATLREAARWRHLYQIKKAFHHRDAQRIVDLMREIPDQAGNAALFLAKLKRMDLLEPLLRSTAIFTEDQKKILIRIRDLNKSGAWPPPDKSPEPYCPG